MAWIQGYGVWIYTPSGSVNDPAAYSVPVGQQGSTATSPPTTGANTLSTTPTSVASTPTSTSTTGSAKALITSTLSNYGLGTLATWAWNKIKAGESFDQIMLELVSTPEYKARFPAMEILAKSGHAITEGTYIQYERSVSEIFKAAGLPSSFYDQPSDFTSFLTNNISTVELQNRVQQYQDAAFSAPQAVRDELTRLYGVTSGELTAFFIDPEKALPLITKRYNAAQAAGYSDVTGFGQLSQAQAELVGNRGLSAAALSQEFGTLAGLSPLFTGLQGTTEGNISTDVALGAGFGQNAQDQAEIEARKQARLAPFQGGGGVAATQTGVVGAGAAR